MQYSLDVHLQLLYGNVIILYLNIGEVSVKLCLVFLLSLILACSMMN